MGACPLLLVSALWVALLMLYILGLFLLPLLALPVALVIGSLLSRRAPGWGGLMLIVGAAGLEVVRWLASGIDPPFFFEHGVWRWVYNLGVVCSLVAGTLGLVAQASESLRGTKARLSFAKGSALTALTAVAAYYYPKGFASTALTAAAAWYFRI